MTKPNTEQQALQAQWDEARETVHECKEELLSAQSMGARKRIAECRKWLKEAEDHEREAFAALRRHLAGNAVPTEPEED